MAKRNLPHKPPVMEAMSILLGMIAITSLAHVIDAYLGLAGVSFLYLILVIWTSYKCQLINSVFVAFGSFLLINFFFVEPRYTFVVGNIESWSALLGFLLVSVAITSLVHQLRRQKSIAEGAMFKANLLKGIIEIFSIELELQIALKKTCDLLKESLGCETSIVKFDPLKNESIQLASSRNDSARVDSLYISHALEFGAILGPDTGTLETLDCWIVPFGRFYKSYELPALVIERVDDEVIEVNLIRVIADQLSVHYQKRIAELLAKKAGEMAHRESVQNAFLASISHDMRTPLTTIIGASSSLLKQKNELEKNEADKLLELIHSEAIYLNDSTENILSLVKLGLYADKDYRMDWQSPEEIVGAVLSRYAEREVNIQIVSHINVGDELVYGDQSLIVLALTNLIENAMSVHLGKNPIKVLVDRLNQEIRIGVVDEGAGFPKDFDKGLAGQHQNYQRNKKGFGLGLSIVKAVMEIHQGRLMIEEVLGAANRTYVGMSFPLKS